MSTFSSLEEIWRRSLDLNLRYYGAVGKLTADYVRDLAATFSEGRKQQDPTGTPTPPAGTTAKPPAEHVATGPTKPAGAMVLEGVAGSKVLGVFLVDNHLDRPISAKIVSSSFVSVDGREVSPTFVFDPETVVLGSREQALVRVVAFIDETMAPEVRYLGQLTIPELMGTPIPVVLRRLIDSDLTFESFESTGSKEAPKDKKGSKTKATNHRRRSKKNQPR
jgi:hypothetical protein